MRFTTTVLICFSWIVAVCAWLPVRAQSGGVTITGTMLSNSTNRVGNYGSLPTDCTYRFQVSAPSVCTQTGWSWTFPNGTTGITTSSTGSSYIDVTFSSSASSYQQLNVQVGGYCNGSGGTTYPSASGSIVLFVAPFNPAAATVAASANPICINTALTLSLQSLVGATTVDWSGNGQTYTSTNAANGFAWTLSNGITAATTFQATIRGCGNATATKTITVTPLVETGVQVAGERDVTMGANQGTVTLTNYKGVIQSWQTSVNNGASWTSLNQTTEEITYTNLTTNTLYRALTSLCGVTYTSGSCTIRVHALTDDLSWMETKTFAQDGSQVLGDSRTYVDGFGKTLQNQVKALSAGKVLATQPLYGKYDQAVGSSLAAPLASTDFAYAPNFISPTSAASAPYDYTRFDDGAKVNSPEAVSSTTANTLGWYYSTNNTVEPYTAITGFPYARTDAVADGSTGVSRSVGPGANLQLGSGHESVQGSFPVRSELDAYAGIRNSLFTTAAVGGQVTSLRQAAVQSLSTDADGTSALVFADKSGHAIVSARPATAADAWTTASNTVEVGWPHSVQIQSSSPLTTLLQFASTADIMAFDNQGKWLITGSADQVAQKIGSSGNIQNYLFYSTDPFTVINDPGTGAAPATYASQAREAYPFFNFYIVGDGSATVTSKPATPNSTYTIINTVTGNPVSLSSSSPLPPGCYQLQIITGAVSLAYTNRYKDISFNFYNQKGQLIESIAPKGVQQLLQNWSSGGTISQPPYVTTFEYDQQGRQLAMNEADAGRTIFVYRADGRLRFSQNAKQSQNNTFSYIGYDDIGRQVESGESQAASAVISDNSYLESTQYGGSGFPGYFTRTNIVRITYDTPSPARGAQEAPNTDHNVAGYTASFLSGQVATVAKYSSGSPYGGYSGKLVSQTWFSYDELGHVKWQIQQTAGQPARTVDYTYNSTGAVETVCYQKNVVSERLTHYYFYDADNRLSGVRTNNVDPAISYSAFYGGPQAAHAQYFYYLTGKLKRVIYGYDLQGVDYTYTASGQLKSINNGDVARDPGQDGTSTLPDFWGTTLNYYQTDYASAAIPGQTTFMASGSNYAQHYNGLVSGISWQTPGSPLNAFGYNYDYKSQLQKAVYGTMTKAASATTQQYTFNADPYRYQESIPDYDTNGNIGHLQRTDGMGASTLAATYQYKSGTNQLTQILNANNPLVAYTYDAIGQVIAQEEQPTGPTSGKYFDYDSNGKVTALYANSNRTQVIARYTYDEYGRRLVQQVYQNPQDQSSYVTTTFVRDIAGQELACYVATTTPAVTNPTALLYEQPIYGATRLGILRQARDQTPTEQLYELNDQLGNTRIVFRRPTTTTYALSMEDARVSQEQQDFPAPTAATYNATRSADFAYGYSSYNASSGVHYSIKLGGGSGQSQSPTKIIPAQRGDSFHLTAYATYTGAGVVYSDAVPSPKTSSLAAGMLGVQSRNMPYSARETQQAPLPGWQQALSHLSIGVGIPLGTATKSQQNTLARSAAANATASTPPNAYLQLLVRKASDNSYVRTATVPVPSSADGNWQQLAVDLTITENYPVLVEVSARGDANLATYFDDLTVQYTLGPIVEENHYYAYGQRLDGLSWRRTDERLYGRGYQGQNTTQDAESGYTAFDLRMYDARYGRWLATDPANQHYSPYIGMGNNPVNGNDSDGGFFQELGNWLTGNGWISNAGKNFIASTPGATYNGWVGSKLSGYAAVGYPDSDGNPVATAFKTTQDLPFVNFYEIETIPIYEAKGYKSGDAYGAVTLPPFGIFTTHADRAMMNHEYGHWLQYRNEGLSSFYRTKGFPSLYNEIENSFEASQYDGYHLSVPHDYYRTETDANARSADYFKVRLNPNKYHLQPKTSNFDFITRGLIYGTNATLGTVPAGVYYK